MLILFIVSLNISNDPSFQKALDLLSVNQKEIEYPKLWKQDEKWVLPNIELWMKSPLKGIDYAENSVKVFKEGNIPTIYKLEARALGINKLNTQVNQKKWINGLPKNIDLPVNRLISKISSAKTLLISAFSGLDSLQKIRILAEASSFWGDEDDSTDDYLYGILLREFGVPYDTSDTILKVKTDTLMEWARKVKFNLILSAGYIVSKGISDFLKEIKGITLPDTIITFKTPIGWVAIGGNGNNSYSDKYALVVDFGGNDTYSGRIAGGIGVLSNPISIVIDVSGDDKYISRDKVFSLGSGLMGIGFLYDGGGNDFYSGFDNSIASSLFGIGIVVDNNGNDIYNGGYFTESASTFGLSILQDNAGNDRYFAQCYAQAMAGTYSYAALLDGSGNDVYYSGGRYPHTPLLPNDYRSMSQGFAIGARPDYGGGIAFLYDGGGNDFYNAEVYAQGTSYWYSAGFLYDEAGNDHYIATEYAQGAGIHLSYGLLIDNAGDDQYFSRYGPSIGEGHDLACGILIDKDGDDSYNVSGGIGVGLTNSFGLFADLNGNDRYLTTENLGEGSANLARGFTGLGIFIDKKGKDTYPYKGVRMDGRIWWDKMYGIGIDGTSQRVKKKIAQKPVPNFTKMDIKQIFDVAAEWEVGDAKDEIKAARKELKKHPSAARKYICDKKMDTESGLELRAIKDFVKAFPDSFTSCLFKCLHSDNKEERVNALYLISEIKPDNAVDSIIPMLKQPKNKLLLRSIIYSIGKIGGENARKTVKRYLNNKDETVKLVSVVALGKIKSPDDIPIFIKKLKSPEFVVRSAAVNALSGYDDTIITPRLLEKFQKGEDPLVIKTFGLIGEKSKQENIKREIKRAIWQGLYADDERYRALTIEALGRIGGDDVKTELKILKGRETSPVCQYFIDKFLDAQN